MVSLSDVRLAKRAALMVGRYAHARQFKRAGRELKFLRIRLGRIIRRKIEGNPVLEAVFAEPLVKSDRIRTQRQNARGPKLYSWRAPETECIAKGKAHKPYVSSGGKPATSFLLALIWRLQASGTVSMIDVNAYARWLGS